VKITLNPNI